MLFTINKVRIGRPFVAGVMCTENVIEVDASEWPYIPVIYESCHITYFNNLADNSG